MATINFTGLASGLDTKALIDAIIEAERQPVQRLIERRTLFNDRRAAYDELASKLSGFESALRDLASERVFRGRSTTVAEESILRASAGTAAETGTFSVDVVRLASASKVKSEGLAARDEPLVTDGTITIQSGDDDPITIDVASGTFNNTLDAIRDEINAADAGVEAAIIFDGDAYRLTVRSEESGEDAALTVSDTTNLDLDGPDSLVTEGLDALLSVDGIDVTSASNSVDGIIPGVTLELLSEGATTVEVAQDVDGLVDAVSGLVDEYNELASFFGEQDNPDDPGVLGGDSTLRRIRSRVLGLFTRGVEGIPIGGLRSLASLGVSFDGKTGQASLDSGELRDVLAQQFSEAGDVFLSSGRADSPRIQFVAAGADTVSGEYAVEVTSAPERATVVGSTAITSIQNAETLTITFNGDSVEVDVSPGLDGTQVAQAINDELAVAGIEATATLDDGKLRISTNAFGADQTLSVASSGNDPADGLQSGFDNTPASDTGADLAGKIGGVDATVDGQLLVAAEDGDYAGITVKVTASADDVTASGGDFGTVSYSRGLLDSLLSEVEDLTRFGSGPIDVARESIDADVKRLGDDITRIEDRLVGREFRLIRTFTQAERAISALQAQQAQLGSVV